MNKNKTLPKAWDEIDKHAQTFLSKEGGEIVGNLGLPNGSISTRSIELKYSTPFIDFHFGNSGTDYTSRIIENESGVLSVSGKLTVNGGITGALTGNSTTATTLQTARTINGTSFNGSANITTANWGTARTLTLGKTGKSVNGSANVAWSIAELGALALTGGTISGNLTVTGAIVANGNVTAYSDRRLKSNIVKIENALDKICSIGGYTFDMLGTGQRQTGVIAQELEKVLPEAVIKNDNGYLSVDYGRVIGLLIEGIKDLKQEIDELKGGK